MCVYRKQRISAVCCVCVVILDLTRKSEKIDSDCKMKKENQGNNLIYRLHIYIF